MSIPSSQFKKIAISAAKLADQKKAGDIVLLDLRRSHSGVADYMVILSANSQTHLNAIRAYIEDSLGDIGVVPAHKEGRKENFWHVLDYGGVLVHIFHEGVRKSYSIERLWEQAKPVEWENGNGHSAPPRGRKKPGHSTRRKRKHA